jgi:hypothetical protein
MDEDVHVTYAGRGYLHCLSCYDACCMFACMCLVLAPVHDVHCALHGTLCVNKLVLILLYSLGALKLYFTES